MKNLFWMIRHLKSALKYVEMGRNNPQLLNFDPEGLELMKKYYENVNELVEKGKRSELDNIGLKQGTDKSVLRMSKRTGLIIGHDYLRHYDFFLNEFREEEFTLLEFGCLRGQSLRMWKEYFAKAQIVGVDLDEETKKNEDSRIDIYIGNAAVQSTCDALKKKYNKIKVIIDDASHAWGDQRRSLEMFWQILARGVLHY